MAESKSLFSSPASDPTQRLRGNPITLNMYIYNNVGIYINRSKKHFINLIFYSQYYFYAIKLLKPLKVYMIYIKLDLLYPEYFVIKKPAFKPVGLCKSHQEESHNEYISLEIYE